MKYVLIEATNLFEHTVSLGTQKLLKENNFKIHSVLKTFKGDSDYTCTINYTVIEINSLEELNKLTKTVGEVILNHYSVLPGGILNEVEGSILIYNDYIE